MALRVDFAVEVDFAGAVFLATVFFIVFLVVELLAGVLVAIVHTPLQSIRRAYTSARISDECVNIQKKIGG